MPSPLPALFRRAAPLVAAAAVAAASPAPAQAPDGGGAERLDALDVFDLEWASDPRISPDGERVAYVRNGFDVMEDGRTSSIWIVGADGSGHRPLTSGEKDAGQPRWSPSGDRLLYVLGEEEGGSELWVRWMEDGQTARIATLEHGPSGLAWSPDGDRIAFSMFVPGEAPELARMPAKPEGADWGPPFRVTTALQYRADGAGWLEPGHDHLFVLPAEGGTPRRLTSGPYDHGGPLSWTPDGGALVFSANRHEDHVRDPVDSDVHRVDVSTGEITTLTDRRGPDGSPVVSPSGDRIAYVGFDDRRQGYQVMRLHVMDADGSDPRVVAAGLDRSVGSPAWAEDGRALFVQYDDEGNTKVARVGLDGEVTPVARDVGGLSLGRPYAGGQYTLSSATGRVAFTHTRPDHPADVAVAGGDGGEGGGARRLTRLNEDLLGLRELGEVEEIRYSSSHDGREIQGWIVKPPGFDEDEEYPLLLEIHGGPFANYGDRFTAELQLYAAAGYVVLYTNPRGSTSYGQAFGNLIHHAYPGHDYDDLVSGVDAMLRRDWVDEDRLFVTGGSGGGVLSAWIVGKTDRFRAAVVQKPVIDWYSFALTADNYAYYWRYWFPGYPWEHREHYFSRSPVSLVEEVETPTMLIVGEEDHRTPASETEQFYAGLQLRGVEAAMVRIPDASHHIAARPSNLVGKVRHVLGWFARHGGPGGGGG
jgi:acylaminoacyl-peptidase